MSPVGGGGGVGLYSGALVSESIDLLTTLSTLSEYNLQSVQSNNSFVILIECICLFSVKLGFKVLLKSLDGE